MSTSTANLPVHGHSLFAAASKFLSAMFAAPKAPAKVKLVKPAAAPAAAAVVAAADAGPNLWKLYRMSAAMDSVNPELFKRGAQD
ncbi:MAG: hypothetical protein V4693_07115 [Pseudomonadota bacterium]